METTQNATDLDCQALILDIIRNVTEAALAVGDISDSMGLRHRSTSDKGELSGRVGRFVMSDGYAGR